MTKAIRVVLAGFLVALLLLPGCAVDPMEQLSQDIESQELSVRERAVLELANFDVERATDALLDVLQGDEELCDAAAVALVKKGREWPAKKKPNAVVEGLGRIAKNVNLLDAARARACWALGEIGSREAVPILKGLTGDAKVPVKDQAKYALEKLGFYTVGRPFDIAWGELAGKLEVIKEPPPVVPEAPAASAEG